MADEARKIELLNGHNYQTWKYNMKLVLMEKGLWGFIDGGEIEPGPNETAAIKRTYKFRSEKTYSMIKRYKCH